MNGVRLDKWLWAARFFKTRGLSSEEIGKGRVVVNGQPAKAAREVKVGDLIELRLQPPRVVQVKALSAVRGPAVVAQTLYEETPESVAGREQLAAARRLEPAQTIAQGRPTKRDRRRLADWNRWSATDDGD
jgi:ribosome-associated heat shock protein Hsp15